VISEGSDGARPDVAPIGRGAVEVTTERLLDEARVGLACYSRLAGDSEGLAVRLREAGHTCGQPNSVCYPDPLKDDRNKIWAGSRAP